MLSTLTNLASNLCILIKVFKIGHKVPSAVPETESSCPKLGNTRSGRNLPHRCARDGSGNPFVSVSEQKIAADSPARFIGSAQKNLILI